MNELLFAMLIIAIIFAVKYYFFDLPLKDKRLYELDKIEDNLYILETSIGSKSNSSEYKTLKSIIDGTRYLVMKDISFKMTCDIVSAVSAHPDRKVLKDMQRLEGSKIYADIYNDYLKYFNKNIAPAIYQKALIICCVLRPFLFIYRIIECIFKNSLTFPSFANLKDIKNHGGREYIQGLYYHK